MFKEILVIDDNPDIRFLICNILKEQNFQVRSAANYDQAVLEINKRLPDLAIIDIKLDKPDKDGIDLLKLVVKKNNLTPVIMISGSLVTCSWAAPAFGRSSESCRGRGGVMCRCLTLGRSWVMSTLLSLPLFLRPRRLANLVRAPLLARTLSLQLGAIATARML